jgi:hypothetical protein
VTPPPHPSKLHFTHSASAAAAGCLPDWRHQLEAQPAAGAGAVPQREWLPCCVYSAAHSALLCQQHFTAGPPRPCPPPRPCSLCLRRMPAPAASCASPALPVSTSGPPASATKDPSTWGECCCCPMGSGGWAAGAGHVQGYVKWPVCWLLCFSLIPVSACVPASLASLQVCVQRLPLHFL